MSDDLRGSDLIFKILLCGDSGVGKTTILSRVTNEFKSEFKVIYQTIENLNKACPNHLGDWYFTGNYPTSGGNKVANRSFMNYVDGINGRAY